MPYIAWEYMIYLVENKLKKKRMCVYNIKWEYLPPRELNSFKNKKQTNLSYTPSFTD